MKSTTLSVVFRRTARTSGAALVTLALVACATRSSPPQPQTARVERATVATTVSASGALAADTARSLGFPRGGQLTKVTVKVGEKVTAGKVLATIDDFAFRQTLTQRRAELAAQRAVLRRIVNGTTVQGARNTLDQAEQVLGATHNQVGALVASDAAAVHRAQRQLDFDRRTMETAKEQLRADEDACIASGGDPDAMGASGQSMPPGTAQSGLGGLATALTAAFGSVLTDPACGRIASDQAAVTAAIRQVVMDKTALDAAVQKMNTDAASGQVSIENAGQSVVAAKNSLDSARSDRPPTIDQQSALVANAQAAVRLAQRDIDDCVLRAPVDGTVSAINGTVGEFLTPGSGLTPLAPGSTAAIPGLAGNVEGVGAPGAGAPRPFLVVDKADSFQVVLPFQEADAAKIAAGKTVKVTFDAMPDLVLPGTVVSVAPSATAISNVINYYATVALTQTDPRLRNGQTAHAAVVADQVDDALSVPNAAVQKRGGQTFVTVVGPEGRQQLTSFQAGLVGDDRTQVLSGIREGQQVVVPQGR